MIGGVEAATLEVEADPVRHRSHERLLGGDRIDPFGEQPVVGPAGCGGTGLHQRHDSIPQFGKPRRDRSPTSTRFVVVEQRIIGIEIGPLAGGLFPLEGEDLLQPGAEQ